MIEESRRRTALALIALFALGFGACKPKEEAPPAPVPSAGPNADHLANDEIPEGRERAFTLPLPLHSTIKARFKDSVHVASSHTQEELANFIGSRVKDGTRTSGASETRFDRVVVTKDPSKTLTIQVRPSPFTGEHRSQIVVNDVTAPPEEPGATDANRWKKAGMTPDGKLLDRSHLE